MEKVVIKVKNLNSFWACELKSVYKSICDLESPYKENLEPLPYSVYKKVEDLYKSFLIFLQTYPQTCVTADGVSFEELLEYEKLTACEAFLVIKEKAS